MRAQLGLAALPWLQIGGQWICSVRLQWLWPPSSVKITGHVRCCSEADEINRAVDCLESSQGHAGNLPALQRIRYLSIHRKKWAFLFMEKHWNATGHIGFQIYLLWPGCSHIQGHFWSGFVREMGKQSWPCTFQDREGPIISTALVRSAGIHWLLSDPEIKGS